MKIWNIYVDKNRIQRYLSRVFVSFFVNLLLYPVYFLSYFVPRDKNLWACGMPQKFTWNSKYVFLEAANSKRKDIKVVWISRNKKLVQELRSQGYPAFFWLSFKGIAYALRSSCHIIDAGIETINFWLSGGAKVVLIWHGIPLKKIGQDVHSEKSLDVPISQTRGLSRMFFRYLFPWQFVKPHYIFATSPLFQQLFASPFGVKPEQVFVTGFPKNDVYFGAVPGSEVGADPDTLLKLKELKGNSSSPKTILYAPTWRDTGGDSFFEKPADLIALDNFLFQEQLFFFLKLHPLAQVKAFASVYKNQYRNIFFVNPDSDADPLLPFVDILVTDYSGIYFEFLLLDRPIVFFPFDYEKYVTQDRELYFEYNKVTPGPKAYSLRDLMEALRRTAQGWDEYKASRSDIKNMAYQYQDSKSAYRVCELLKQLLRR